MHVCDVQSLMPDYGAHVINHTSSWRWCVWPNVYVHHFLDRAGASESSCLSRTLQPEDSYRTATLHQCCKNLWFYLHMFKHIKNAQVQGNIFVLNCPRQDMPWWTTYSFYPPLRWWLSNICAIHYVSVKPELTLRTFRTDHEQQEKAQQTKNTKRSLQLHSEQAYGALCWL